MIRNILKHPHPDLRRMCVPVLEPDAGLISDMFDTMYDAPGRGLAAPQVGVLERVFVIDTGWKDGEKNPRAFLNPELLSSAGSQTNEEGCLSIPDAPRRVARALEIELMWLDQTGTQRRGRFEGIEAACILHEMDHLDGRLILDHPEAP